MGTDGHSPLAHCKDNPKNCLYLTSLGKHSAAAAAKSLQLCPTLCDPIDGSPPGSPVPGILQARTLEWVAISFSKGKCSLCLQRHYLSRTSVSLCCSVAKLYPNLFNPMICGMSGFLVLHCFPQFAQTHVHWVGEAIQPSHPLSSPSPPALNLSHHQGLFQWASSLHQVAKVLDHQLQHQSFQ